MDNLNNNEQDYEHFYHNICICRSFKLLLLCDILTTSLFIKIYIREISFLNLFLLIFAFVFKPIILYALYKRMLLWYSNYLLMRYRNNVKKKTISDLKEYDIIQLLIKNHNIIKNREEECMICLENKSELSLNCHDTHSSCIKCLSQWTKKMNSCPCCREEILTQKMINDYFEIKYKSFIYNN